MVLMKEMKEKKGPEMRMDLNLGHNTLTKMGPLRERETLIFMGKEKEKQSFYFSIIFILS